MNSSTPYEIPKEPGRWRAILLAAFVHAVLLGFLWFGVHWQNETPIAVEAEVWSPQPREAAPRPVPQPEPEPEPEKPEPRPVVQEPPKPVVPEPPIEKPDIALEQEKKRLALEKKKREEQEQAERLAKQKKDEAERQAKLKQQEEEKERLVRLKQQEAQKQAEKEKADKERKLAEEKRRQEEEFDKQLAKIREEDMKRMAAGITGSGGSGDAARSQGGRADASYAQRLGAKIKSNTIFNAPDELPGNPSVEYVLELLPDGSLKGQPRKTKSSGVPGFDEAVLRAIERSQPYPRNNSGVVPPSLIVSQKLKDQ